MFPLDDVIMAQWIKVDSTINQHIDRREWAKNCSSSYIAQRYFDNELPLQGKVGDKCLFSIKNRTGAFILDEYHYMGDQLSVKAVT